MKFDLHMHCREYSPCSIFPVRKMLQQAVSAGLDAVALTNHNLFVEDAHIQDLREEFSTITIFNGIEVSIGDEHIICMGVLDPKLETWTEGYEELYSFMNEKGGYMILAHPFRFRDYVNLDIDSCPPHGVELHSSNTGRGDEGRILEFADKYKLKLFANSDAHSPEAIGLFCNEVDSEPQNEYELVEALKACPVKIHEDKELIEGWNSSMEESENEIRSFIEKGGTAAEYTQRYKRWDGYYNRVKDGKSYCI